MSHPLDNLIRQFDCENLPPSSETLVYVNAGTGEVLLRKPSLLEKMRYDFKCYIVTGNFAEVNVPDCPVYPVRDRAGRAISLNVEYTASCQSDAEMEGTAVRRLKVVKALFKQHSVPATALEQLIKQWIQEVGPKEPGRFIDTYFSLKEQLETHLSQKAAEIGLVLEVRLSLKNGDLIKPLQIPTLETTGIFRVLVKDYDDELSLKIKDALLRVAEETKINIVATNEKEAAILELLQNEIGIFLRENTTVHEFCYHQDTLRDKLVDHLNRQVLLSSGRKMTSLALEKNTGKLRLPEEFPPQFTYEIECTIKDSRDPIGVKHTVLVNLDDLGKYTKAKIDNLDTWLNGTIKRITQATLLEKSYADVVLDLNTEPSKITQEIRYAVEQEAKSIGYSIKHLMVIPNLEPFDLKLQGISFEQEEVFETKDPRIKDAKLNIVVRAKINNFERIKAYLNPRIKILDEIKRTVTECARFLIHGIDPERFYLRFYPSDRPGEVSEVSVADELTMEISQQLQEKFGLENIEIIPKQQESRLVKRYLDLLKGAPHDFKVITSPIGEGGKGEAVEFTGSFRVVAIAEHGWGTFRQTNYESPTDEIEAIKKTLQTAIKYGKSGLDLVPSSFLKYTNQEIRMKIEKAVKMSTEEIRNIYGLEIEIIGSLSRSLTKWEETIFAKYQDGVEMQREIQHFEKQEVEKLIRDLRVWSDTLAKDEQKLLKAYFDEEDDEGLKNLRQQKDNLRKQIEDLKKKLESDTQLGMVSGPAAFDFDKHLKQIGDAGASSRTDSLKEKEAGK
ncbi:MAG: hypothetical protein BWK78_00590 [Thiotrichaceae bacterium IS1]|nr:MAG: hypothetical protein BWK78_00590 [Thiotrichaceae bacterium IS1]